MAETHDDDAHSTLKPPGGKPPPVLVRLAQIFQGHFDNHAQVRVRVRVRVAVRVRLRVWVGVGVGIGRSWA